MPGARGNLPPGAGVGPPPGMAAGGPRGGGMFGGNESLTSVLRYVSQHGGGTVAVSSQTGASSTIIQSGADVAGIGGFSGRESSVSVNWLADAVASGQVRWVLTGGELPGGPGGDTRAGSTRVMAAVAQSCTAVPSSAYSSATTATNGGSSSALYDCTGKAAALRAAGSAS
jgi:hypothetical protein